MWMAGGGMRTIDTETVPIYVWGESVDEPTLAQARNLANLPFAFHHIALMPDAHIGYGMPIGGVFAALGCVIPHAVGLDIGCGVRGWCTNLPREDVLAELERLDVALFKHRKQDVAEEAPEAYKDIDDVMRWQRDLVQATVRLRPLGVVKG